LQYLAGIWNVELRNDIW